MLINATLWHNVEALMSAVLDVSCPPRSYIGAGFIPPKLPLGDPALAINSSTAFVSYSRADSDFALKLAEDLHAAGASVWLDQIELEPGKPWDMEIQRALMICNRMLVVLSPTSVNSTNVLDEVSFALKKQKTVIPVLYQDCEIPLRLHRLQYVNLLNYDRGLRILLRSLADPGQPPARRPAPRSCNPRSFKSRRARSPWLRFFIRPAKCAPATPGSAADR